MTLSFDGRMVPLPPKSLELLRLFVERPGATLERGHLIEKLWDQPFVEEANLTVTVSRLRKALAQEEPNETYIQTIPRVGYRFIGVVDEVEDAHRSGPQPTVSSLGQISAPDGSTFKPRRSRPPWLLAAAALTVLLVAAGVGSRFGTGPVYSNNSEANIAFLKGDAALSKRRPCESIPYFQTAVDRDQTFARGFARLSAAQAMCPALDGVEDNIAKALELDPNLAEAHATDGFIKMFRNWDWSGAERSLRRAVELDPNSAVAHHWLGVYLSVIGRLGEARGELQRAIDLDPLSALYLADLCQIHYFMRRYEIAERSCRRSLEIDHKFYFAHQYLRDIYLATGEETRAAEFEILATTGSSGTDSDLVIKLRESLTRSGLRQHWLNQLDLKLAEVKTANSPSSRSSANRFHIAQLYTSLGDKDNALTWFTEAVKSPDGPKPFRLVYLAVDPRYDLLRGDPRFSTLLTTMGLAKAHSNRGSDLDAVK